MHAINANPERMDALFSHLARRAMLQRSALSLRELLDEEDEGRRALLEIDDIIAGKA